MTVLKKAVKKLKTAKVNKLIGHLDANIAVARKKIFFYLDYAFILVQLALFQNRKDEKEILSACGFDTREEKIFVFPDFKVTNGKEAK